MDASDTNSLPNTPQELQALCLQLQAQLAEKEQQLADKQSTIEYLQERLAILLSKRYQAQTEQLKALQGQLFDEAELEAAIRETEAALAEAQALTDAPPSPPKPKTDRPKRHPLPAHLPRVDIIIDVDEADKQQMGDAWVLVGYECSEQLAVQQRRYFVKRFKRAKYVRQEAAETASPICTEAGIKVAPRPDVILPKAIADSSLLADVMAAKFVDALSFYRTDKILQREGIEIGYSTLCSWPIQLAERLAPLQGLLLEYLRDSELWHLDETTLQVLQEPNREAQTKSYIWGIRGGPPNQPVVLFHYHPRRNYEALQAWLAPVVDAFHGVIVTDEHGPYNRLAKAYPNIAAHGGCWAHCRRKFADAAKGRKSGSDAHRVLAQIAVLYRLDKGTAHLQGEARTQARRERVQPHLDKLKRLLDNLAAHYLKKGAMGDALGYARNQWHKLTAFIDQPAMPLDNNPIEQAIRPFTLGRKNWLFSGSPKGAAASVFLYSLVETAKANGWEPRAYLQALFERYPLAKTREQQRALLPMFLKPSELAG